MPPDRSSGATTSADDSAWQQHEGRSEIALPGAAVPPHWEGCRPAPVFDHWGTCRIASLQALHGVYPAQRHSLLRGNPNPRALGADGCALLRRPLDRKVAWNKETSLLPLSKKKPALGTLCSVAGWGIFRQNSKYSPVLRELNVKVMDSKMCNNSRYWHGEVTGAMMCIEGVEKGSAPCKGDSGGPVVCGKKAEVAGVLSFAGKSCIDVFKPPVATAVFKYKKWIKKYLR
ncbi:granzyme M-like isoform X2 [Lepidochelys kempii]|uniref:granzyme M-like isoform X2 n=1 Tax=Lepidochelys kempii TaxID=8472 RepID=UPI003C702DBE